MRSDTVNLTALRRLWWFPPTGSLPRAAVEAGFYSGYALDAQPRLNVSLDGDLAWLEDEPASDVGIDTSDVEPTRRLNEAGLHELLGELPTPPALAALAQKPWLQSRIRSGSACYLDLGQRAVPTDAGGALVHFLSDQQWIRHWMVLVGDQAPEVVLSSEKPIGFNLMEDDPPSSWVPDVVPLDGSIDLSVCADSLEEFFYRYWIENEIVFRSSAGRPLDEPFASYARQVTREQ